MQYQLITQQANLQHLCEKLSHAKILTVDTEFVRTRTLYAKLGLLQVCDGENLALIDPLAVDDLSPFWQLLKDDSITKVLHACSEDLEVFLTAGNCKPVNVIDSQIMMSFLGHGLSIGYAAMIKHFTGIELDKSESRTDWVKRPLTKKQLDYASADVEYLFTIYPKLVTELKKVGFLNYAQLETLNMINKKFTAINPETLYLNVKMSWRLNAEQLNILKHLTIWRYQQAQKRDIPISFVAKDHTLIALAQGAPQSVSAMLNLEGIDLLDVRHKGKAMLSVINQANKVDSCDYPNPIKRLDEYPGYKQTFKKVKAFLVNLCEKHELAIENLASKKQINQFLMWHFDLNNARTAAVPIDLLTSWRQELIGRELIGFVNNGYQ